MDHDFKGLTANLAQRLIELRQRRNLTQNALAKMVELPRSTVTNLESGQGNPSLAILAKLSVALHIPIDQLLAPEKTVCKLMTAIETPIQERAQGNVKIYKLLPDNLPNMDIDRLEIQSGHTMKGIPHAPGTKEYFHCIQGELTIKITGHEYIIKKGDTLAFPGQSPHHYFNHGKSVSIGVSIVVLTPLSM